MSLIISTTIQWGTNSHITSYELTELNYLFFWISCHSIWPISHLHTIPIKRCAFWYALVTDASICFPSLFISTLVEVYRSSSKRHGPFSPVFIHRILLDLGLEDFLASEPVHIIAHIGATFLRQRTTQMKASSKRPRVESSTGDVSRPPPSGDPSVRSLSIPPLLLILRLPPPVMLPFGVCWRLSLSFRQCMDRFWWMCLLSFRLYVRIWRVFNILPRLHLLMMSFDCPLSIRHKKRGVFIHVDRGRFCVFVDRGRFRLYLGDSWCIFFIGSWCICFYGMYMLGGDIIFLFLLLFLVSHVLH